MSRIQLQNANYGDALQYANNAVKYLPSSDGAYKSNIQWVLSSIHLNLKDTVRALECIDKAIKIDKKSETYRLSRANIFLSLGNVKKAEQDFREVLKNNEASPQAYIGLGRVCLIQDNLDGAVSSFSKAINLDAKNQNAYSWRAMVFELQGRYSDAIDDHIAALYLGYSAFDYRRLRIISGIQFAQTISSLKEVAEVDRSNSMWYFIIGNLFEDNNKYESAIESYMNSYAIDNDAFVASSIAECYVELGNYACAMKYVNDAIKDEPEEAEYYCVRANIYDLMGNYDKALEDLDLAINKATEDMETYYHSRGSVKYYHGDLRGALKDYGKAIAIDKDFSNAYLKRGILYNELGFSSESRQDFQMVISLESDTNYFESRPFAHYYMGQYSEAKRTMRILLRHGGNVYDAACLYSLLEDHTLALDYLEKAFQGGYRNFAHIERDHDLDNIRQEARFKRMIAKYKELPVGGDCTDETPTSDTVVYIPFTKGNGVYHVKCNVNGLDLDFIFDTGASDVTLSSNEATFMLKQGYLLSKDIKGEKYYMNANGSIDEGVVVNLREVNLGGLVLNNINATIVNNDHAPALLGQSVLAKFGKIEIDYNRQQIKITRVGNGYSETTTSPSRSDGMLQQARNGASELLTLLKNTQANPKFKSKLQTDRDGVAYDCKDALKELSFYTTFYNKGAGLESSSASVRQVSAWYKTAMKKINDYLRGEADDLDFADLISQIEQFLN